MLKYLYSGKSYEQNLDDGSWEVLMVSLTLLMYIYTTSCEIILFHVKEKSKIAKNYVTISS